MFLKGWLDPDNLAQSLGSWGKKPWLKTMYLFHSISVSCMMQLFWIPLGHTVYSLVNTSVM